MILNSYAFIISVKVVPPVHCGPPFDWSFPLARPNKAEPGLHHSPVFWKPLPLPSLVHLKQNATVCFGPLSTSYPLFSLSPTLVVFMSTCFPSPSSHRHPPITTLPSPSSHHCCSNPLTDSRRPPLTMDEDGGQISPKPSNGATPFQTPTQPGVPDWMLARNNSEDAPVFGQPSLRKRYVFPTHILQTHADSTFTATVASHPACPHPPSNQGAPRLFGQISEHRSEVRTSTVSSKPMNHRHSHPRLWTWVHSTTIRLLRYC